MSPCASRGRPPKYSFRPAGRHVISQPPRQSPAPLLPPSANAASVRSAPRSFTSRWPSEQPAIQTHAASADSKIENFKQYGAPKYVASFGAPDSDPKQPPIVHVAADAVPSVTIASEDSLHPLGIPDVLLKSAPFDLNAYRELFNRKTVHDVKSVNALKAGLDTPSRNVLSREQPAASLWGSNGSQLPGKSGLLKCIVQAIQPEIFARN